MFDAMDVEHIAAVRAVYLNLLMEVSGRFDSHDPASLRRYGLPPNPAVNSRVYVPLRAVLAFAQWAACGTDIQSFAVQVGCRLQVSMFSVELRDALLSAPALGVALERFSRLADREQSNLRYEVIRRGREVWITSRSQGSEPESGMNRFGEWLSLMLAVTVVRHFAGPGWTPSAISLQGRVEPGEQVRAVFGHTRFSCGQDASAIALPEALLRLAAGPNDLSHAVTADCVYQNARFVPVIWSFPASLRVLVAAYLDDGYPDIKLAARIAGCSVRTLQRRLKQFNVSYTDIVQQARFTVASHLLRDPRTKVIDAALAVGYDDPSHFTRAFRRLAGVTPNQYRRLNHARTGQRIGAGL